MTDTQFADLLRPMMPAIIAKVRARIESERVTTFADESDDSPQFRPAFGPDDVERYSDYFADDNGSYPHSLHRHFGMSVRDFANATKLVRKPSAGPDGKLVWNWAKRPAAQSQTDDNADVEMFSLDQVNEFSDRKEGERWVTNGRHYKREGGRTVRYSPEKENAGSGGGGAPKGEPQTAPKKEPAKAPEPTAAPGPAKPSAPTKADVRSRLDAAFAGPSKLTAEHFAALKDDLLATHTGDELRALAEERKTRLTGTKAVRVQALIDAAKAKAKASAGGEKEQATKPEATTDTGHTPKLNRQDDSPRRPMFPSVNDPHVAKVPESDVRDLLMAIKETPWKSTGDLAHFSGIGPKLGWSHDRLAYTLLAAKKQNLLRLYSDEGTDGRSGDETNWLFATEPKGMEHYGLADLTPAGHEVVSKGGEVKPKETETAPSKPTDTAPSTPAPVAKPHSQARAALDALGLAHSHLSDDDVMQRLRAAFAPPTSEPKPQPKAQPKPSPKQPSKSVAKPQPAPSAGKPGHDKVTALQSELTDLAHTNPASAPTRDQIYDRVAKALDGHDPREVAKLSGYPAGVIGNKANALKLIQNSIADTVGAVKRVAGDRILAEQQAKELAEKEARRREKAKAKKTAAAGGKPDTKGGK